MTELDAARAELKKLRERAEGLARKTEILERRLSTTIPEGDVSSTTVGFVGDWPKRQAIDLQFDNGKPDVATAESPESHAVLRPYPGHACLSLYDEEPITTGFSAIGLRGGKLAAFVDYIAEKQRLQRNFVPVFLTDSTEFHLFRRHGFVFEYIPSPSDRQLAGGAYSWDRRIAERTAFFKRKWGVEEIFDVAAAMAVRPS